MSRQKVDPTRIERHFEKLSKIGNLGATREEGFLRAGWSDEESAAFRYIKEFAEASGLLAEEDSIGNLFLRATVSDSKNVVQIGSHLDTVPRGGLFDGGAGIVAGLEAILTTLQCGKEFSANPELVLWRSEESATWRAVCIGSRAAIGANSPAILENRFGEYSLREAIASQGYDPLALEQQTPTLSAERLANVRAHLELHIEQSIQLENSGVDIGIVTSIRGTRRSRIIVEGEAAHSGGTPMGKACRRDANLAMAYMLTRLNDLLEEEIAGGADLVQTAGVINSDKNFNARHPGIYENAVTKVSPLGYFSLDCRSNNRAFLDLYVQKANSLISDTAAEFGVGVSIEPMTAAQPVEALDDSIQKIALDACEECGYSSLRLPSGAMHDAAIIAGYALSEGKTIPVGMLFIPCRKGISHSPLEYASAEAVSRGADVLAGMLLTLCR